MSTDYDVVVVGSGFGGSVTALRLAEKGYRVGVLEAGRRFTDATLPKTSWDLRAFLWAPAFGLKGMQKITWLKDVVVLSGAGVGGGSLVYANTLYTPPPPFFSDPQWQHITDWSAELAPHYEQATRMLGVVEQPSMTPADHVMKSVAEDMGVGHTFRRTPVGVYYGTPGQTDPDPYFGGKGPARTGCTECGNCMIGCRYGAKNRLDLNYLHLAEGLGTMIHPETTVTTIEQGERWTVTTKESGTFTCDQLVLAAGALGTQKLLFGNRGRLSRLSNTLGVLTRTNSEALLGAMAKKVDGIGYSEGVAITSSFHPDEHTHIEPCRYGPGSSSMGLLTTMLVDGSADGAGRGVPRPLRWAKEMLTHPGQAARSLSNRKWAQRTIIALVMQSLDNSITVTPTKRGRLTSRPGHGPANPTWIPQGHEAARLMAAKIGGHPGGTLGDVVNVPMTAHILGGCVIGATAAEGVVDPYHRVHGYPTLHVVDGSSISANLGVNPSLTITAQAERAMALWPNRAETDQRPAQGQDYVRLEPVAPVRPAVPAAAPGALRLLPLTVVRSDQQASGTDVALDVELSQVLGEDVLGEDVPAVD